MEQSQRRVAREKHSFPFLRCQGPSPIRQQPWCGLPLSLAAALICAGCAAPTYEQTHDSLSALSSVLGVVATAVPGASAVGLASNSRLVGKGLEMGELARRVSALEPQGRRREKRV